MIPDPAPVLTETDLFELLRLEFDADALAYLVQRRGLPSIVFRRDGRVVRRFLREDILNWLRAESGKRNGRAAGREGER